MAIKRLTIDGYGQVELNNCAFRRDGRIEAQCKPSGLDVVENGMLLAVDKVTKTVKLPADDTLPIALNYSAEHIYDERTPGLKSFALKGSDDFLPRVGYLAQGDVFTENCICYDDATYTSDADVLAALAACATTRMYGYADATGAVLVTSATEKPSTCHGSVKLIVAGKTTMPDGTVGVKFQVLNA